LREEESVKRKEKSSLKRKKNREMIFVYEDNWRKEVIE